MAKKVFRNSEYDTGFSNQDWSAGWDQMKMNGTYDVPYFGDLFFMSK